jgi:hypothetical protein
MSFLIFGTEKKTKPVVTKKVINRLKKNVPESIKKTKWFKPYYNKFGNKIPQLNMCWDCQKSGVYFIRKTSTGKTVYIGQSQSQLKKTIYRHFQKWTDRQQSTQKTFERKTYPKFGYEIRFILCVPQDALRLESYLIQKIKPIDNPLKYENLTRAEIIKGQQIDEKAKQATEIHTKEYIANLEAAPF